jgi:hypothetical protein
MTSQSEKKTSPLSRSTSTEREFTTDEQILELERWIEDNPESGGLAAARKQLAELRGEQTKSASGGLS